MASCVDLLAPLAFLPAARARGPAHRPARAAARRALLDHGPRPRSTSTTPPGRSRGSSSRRCSARSASATRAPVLAPVLARGIVVVAILAGSRARPAARVAARPGRRRPRRARAPRRRARTGLCEDRRARSGPGRRQRDEHARRAPLGTPADPQLPAAAGRELGRGRHQAPQPPRPRERAGGVPRGARRSAAGPRASCSSQPTTACSPSADGDRPATLSDGDRLGQQVRAEREAADACGGIVVVRTGEGHGPGQVPDREVRGRRAASRTRRPPGVRDPRARRGRARRIRPARATAEIPSATPLGMPACSRRAGMAKLVSRAAFSASGAAAPSQCVP